MNVADVMARLGLKHSYELADRLEVSRSAITKWSKEDDIPHNQWFRLKYVVHPEVFGKDPDPVYVRRTLTRKPPARRRKAKKVARKRAA